mmetsp:Transcript_58661/g.132196  ORF Transcript_58661/g.132196 Transcript_58661/m.132196 type:complete len:383 (-) Transcript_58661:107-1255(-)|eukprot:CAMPEP_0197914856 /NCGR_PEP_ID=MMETSP1439-20131203/79234_1 /TAXON_ID=66791 /ORGANISM="Gonyaulax spinifera, Strain CCMP409" /LENGTH=382 /DNA_ID=CAMNT_0043536781 /DNA_START=97 /DNA_END=1245 /DNA_ORIENTATION=+
MGQGPITGLDGEHTGLFKVDVASPSCAGKKSVLSEPIDTFGPEDFWRFFPQNLRRREPRPPIRSYTSRETEDGGILTVKVLDRGGGKTLPNYSVWHLRQHDDEATVCDYGADRTLTNVDRRLTLKVHRDPFRIECWSFESEACGNHPLLMPAMEALLGHSLASKASCRVGVPSPGGPGRNCVLSDSIRDTAVAPDELWREVQQHLCKCSEQALSSENCTVLEDEARGAWMLSGATTASPSRKSKQCWVKHVFNGPAYELHSFRHGDDATLSEESLEHVVHFKIHWRPYRLEMWTTLPPRRLSGEPEKAFILDLLFPVFEQAKELAKRRREEDSDRAKVQGFREEIAMCQNSLRKELEALCAEVAEIAAERSKAEAAAPEASR